jgi:hypothetical protein
VTPAELLTYRDRLAIVGSSTFRAPDGLRLAERKIRELVDDRRPDLIVSGRCRFGGVDDLAERIATERGIPFLPHPARHQRWAGEGGFT